MSKILPLNLVEYSSKVGALNAYQGGAVKQGPQKVGVQGPSIPFGQLTGGSSVSVAPPDAKQNYENGLAPLSKLQNVFAGEYKGKENILNQIGIA